MIKGNWHRIMDALEKANLNPYPVGIHEGKATEPYVVVREAETIPYVNTNNLVQQIYDIIIIVPVTQYAMMETMKMQVKQALEPLEFLRRTGFESVNTTDPDRMGTSCIIEYTVLKRSEKHKWIT